jgi:hypothetical protein
MKKIYGKKYHENLELCSLKNGPSAKVENFFLKKTPYPPSYPTRPYLVTNTSSSPPLHHPPIAALDCPPLIVLPVPLIG